MRAVVRQLLHSQGLQQTVVTVGGNTLATGISAIAIMLISRLLGPTSFGEFTVGFAIILMLNKINDFGLNGALVKFVPRISNQAEVDSMFAYALKVKLFLSIVIIGVGIVMTPVLNQILHFNNPTLLYLAFVLSVASTWYEHLLAMLQAVHRFSQAVVANAIQSTAKLIGISLLFLLGVSATLPIFTWYMVAPIFPVVLVAWLLGRKLPLQWQSAYPQQRQQLWSMARHSAVGFIAGGMIENIDVLFVQRYLNAYETGLLGGVSRIAMMLALIAYSLGNVLYPRVARYHEASHLKLYLKKASMLAGLSVVGFIMTLPFTRLFIYLTIGTEYLPGNYILIILIACSFLTIATVPFLALFYSFKADWYFSTSGVIQLLIVLIGNAWFVPVYGLQAAAWTRLVARLFLFGYTIGLALWLYYRLEKNEQSKSHLDTLNQA